MCLHDPAVREPYTRLALHVLYGCLRMSVCVCSVWTESGNGGRQKHAIFFYFALNGIQNTTRADNKKNAKGAR